MTTTLSDKNVKIRKARQCSTCLRRFEKGAEMNRQVNTYEGVQAVYTCTTCLILLDKYTDYCFDFQEGFYVHGCIDELLQEPENRGKTPEDLL